jgi:hypothetical protein
MTDVTLAEVLVTMLLHDIDLQLLPWEAAHLLVHMAMEVGALMVSDNRTKKNEAGLVQWFRPLMGTE